MKFLYTLLFIVIMCTHLIHGINKQNNKHTLLGTVTTFLVGAALLTDPTAVQASTICEGAASSNYILPGCRTPKIDSDGMVNVCVKHFKLRERHKKNSIQTNKTLNPLKIAMDQQTAEALFEHSAFWKFNDNEPNIITANSYLRAIVKKLANILGRKNSKGLIVATRPDTSQEHEFDIPHEDAFPEGHCGDTLYVYDYRYVYDVKESSSN